MNTHKQSTVTLKVFVLWLRSQHYYTRDVIWIKMYNKFFMNLIHSGLLCVPLDIEDGCTQWLVSGYLIAEELFKQLFHCLVMDWTYIAGNEVYWILCFSANENSKLNSRLKFFTEAYIHNLLQNRNSKKLCQIFAGLVIYTLLEISKRPCDLVCKKGSIAFTIALGTLYTVLWFVKVVAFWNLIPLYP